MSSMRRERSWPGLWTTSYAVSMSTAPTSSDPHRRNNDGGHQATADDLVPGLLSNRPGQDWDFLAGTHAAAWCALPNSMADSRQDYRGHVRAPGSLTAAWEGSN